MAVIPCISPEPEEPRTGNSTDMEASVKPDPDGDDFHTGSSSIPRAHKRRPHTKSRNGCTTCKRRRVKCDETRPICKNCQHLRLECRYVTPASLSCADLQTMNLKLLHHYDRVVAKTISDAGISTEEVWSNDVVEMGFKHPYLMHAILMFSAAHLAQREPKEYCNAVVQHRSEALALLRNVVQRINSDNLDPLVATSVLLILDAMANAALPSRMLPCSLPASTWLHHVRGAATILLAVGVLPPTSKFYSFMGVDLLDLANFYSRRDGSDIEQGYSSLQCFMPELSELYPVALDSPYFSSLAFLDKLHHQRGRADFILRVFSFPALMDREFVRLLAAGDKWAKQIVSAYYRLVRNYVREMHGRVWFLNGVATVLPIDMDNQFGGLGFVTDALPVSQNVDSILAKFDASFAAADNMHFDRVLSSYLDDTGMDATIDSKLDTGIMSGYSSNVSSAGPSPPTAPNTAPGSLAASPQGGNYPQNYPAQPMPPMSVRGPEAQPISQSIPPDRQSGNQTVNPGPYNQSRPPATGQTFGNGPGIGGVPNLPHTQLSDIMPHTFGRIHKQSMTGGHLDFSPVPGSGSVQSNSFSHRSRPISRNEVFGGRNRNIIRPGMMGLPIDPSIPGDLLGGFDFAGMEYQGNEDTDIDFKDPIFDPETLEWKQPGPQQMRQLKQEQQQQEQQQQQQQHPMQRDLGSVPSDHPFMPQPPLTFSQQGQQRPPQMRTSNRSSPSGTVAGNNSLSPDMLLSDVNMGISNDIAFERSDADAANIDGLKPELISRIKQEEGDFRGMIDFGDNFGSGEYGEWNAN